MTDDTPRSAQSRSLPERLTGELACILENCDPQANQTPEAVAALIESYQPTWDKILAALAPGNGAVEADDPSEPLQCLRCGTVDAFGPVSKEKK
jgi:hypothetical protein